VAVGLRRVGKARDCGETLQLALAPLDSRPARQLPAHGAVAMNVDAFVDQVQTRC
jgi:hypothetical protein